MCKKLWTRIRWISKSCANPTPETEMNLANSHGAMQLERFLSIDSRDPSVSKTIRLHIANFRYFFLDLKNVL
jgi:hypothetical protein